MKQKEILDEKVKNFAYFTKVPMSSDKKNKKDYYIPI